MEITQAPCIASITLNISEIKVSSSILLIFPIVLLFGGRSIYMTVIDDLAIFISDFVTRV